LFNTCVHNTRTCVNFVLCIGVLCIEKIVECFGGTPNCTGRSIINNAMFDSGVYSNIGSIRFFKCKFNLNKFLFTTNLLDDTNADEELDESKTSTIQMSDLVDDDILYSGRGNEKDAHCSDDY
jgi:hypothetical protein